MPDYQVDSVVLLGEGMENIAYEVNRELIVRFSKAADAQQRAVRVEREARLLALVAGVSPLPVPVPRFTAVDQGCLAYAKVLGVPLRDVALKQRTLRATSFAPLLGAFLSAVHAIPLDSVADLVDTDDQRLTGWLRDADELYRTLAHQLPVRHRRAVEAFFKVEPPDNGYALVFAHNDLGIEHIVFDPATWTMTGIIDWSDAALADPAYDFGLLYRDLGPRALHAAIEHYRTDLNDVERLRQRAVFYARCSVFEDLAYGLEMDLDASVQNSLATLEWLFPR